MGGIIASDPDADEHGSGRKEAPTKAQASSRQMGARLDDDNHHHNNRQEEKKCKPSDIDHCYADRKDRGLGTVSSSSGNGSGSGRNHNNDLKRHFFQRHEARSKELAQSNAEDVVNLSLEVQKLKAQFEQGEEKTAQVRAGLEADRARSEELRVEVQQQRRDLVEANKKYCNDIKELMVECQQSKIRIKAAEDDAEQALDLARANDDSRAEMEEYLQRSLDEIEQLRTAHAQQQQQQALQRISEDAATSGEEGGWRQRSLGRG